MRKTLSILAVVFILGFLPLGSYLYLKSGFKFRKQLITELDQKIPFVDTLISNGLPVKLKSHCTVVSIMGNENDVIGLYGQFKDAKGFQMAASVNPQHLLPVFGAKNAEDSIRLKENYFRLADSSMAVVKQKFPNASYLIIDSMTQIRKVYEGNVDDMKRMAGHITVLLPLYKEN
ncbi:MAG: hypothetical protein IPN29_15600 [Saprospiraceae bacterium]|nr:hypothetical protein [Saprospiraceae bacterium]